MLMNGEAQRVIGQDDSLVVKTAAAQKTPEQQVESLYLSFFSRKPHADELADPSPPSATASPCAT
jgi:hypothetical protein